MSAQFIEYIKSGVEPLPDSVYGPGYRCSAYLRDGTFLPCVMLRQVAPLTALALRRFEEEKQGKGIFRSGGNDAYQKIVEHFILAGNHVNNHDIVRVETSRFAIPIELLRQVEGETTMSWTGFVLEMNDGKRFSYGTTFLAEFFSLPDGYEFRDAVRIYNHAYVSPDGSVKQLVRGMAAQPLDYEPSRVLRERPYFTCHYDS